jgi:transposase
VYRSAGAKGKYSRREMLNAIFYVLRTGCQWTDLPHDFPPWKSVYSQFLRWRDRNLFPQINQSLRRKLRTVVGRTADPSAGIVDSQSVKTTEKKGFADMTEVRRLRVGNDTFWLITLDC